MRDEQLNKLIQENLENCWRQFARTGCLSIQKTKTAVHMNSGTSEPLLNSVIQFCPSEKNLLQEIEKLEHFYYQKKLPFCWWIAQGPLFERIDEKLKARGFSQTMEVAGMVLDIRKLPSLSNSSSILPNDITLVHASTPQHFSDWMAALHLAFDMDEAGANWYKNIIEKTQKLTDAMQCYVAYYENKPVSSLTLFLDKKVASFYNVGTIPDFRNKGLTTSMSLYCLDIARKKGYSWATLQANPNSVGLFSRMGFNTTLPYLLYFK